MRELKLLITLSELKVSMHELDRVIKNAYTEQGVPDKANKVYVTFFRTSLYMPVRYQQHDENEPFTPLFLQDADKYFIPLFDSLERLQAWAVDQSQALDHVEILGADVIRGAGETAVLFVS